MTALARFVFILLGAWLLAIGFSPCAFAAATIDQSIQPTQVNVGEQVVLTLTLHGGNANEVNLPAVDGLQITGTRSVTNISVVNGGLARSLIFYYSLIPAHAGDFTIPAFDVHTDEGDIVHVRAMKLHAVNTLAANSDLSDANIPANPATPGLTPPADATAMTPSAPGMVQYQTSSEMENSSFVPPREKDGAISKVFIIISPQTTDAYVGQSVPMKIEFFIRQDVNADQNSLPTIKGSDFLMNSFTTRGHLSVGMIEGQQYERELWYTAITAPKSGDFPLSMERDTYWVKSYTNNNYDPFGGYLNRHANLAHDMVASNLLTMHVHPLPDDGRPTNFTGAIGNFQVSGDAQPSSVAVGEPVTLYYSIAGEGNFDYVRCPTIPANPAWKTYVPASKMNFRDEAHIGGVKMFEQSLIANSPGTLQLPEAAFSYFNPLEKKYVTLTVPFAPITVTGSAIEATNPRAPGPGDNSVAATPRPNEMIPNRLELGYLRASLTPAYRKTWFWIAQGVLLTLPPVAIAILFARLRAKPDRDAAARELRERTRRQDEDAMAAAVRQGDAASFFIAARHALQLQLGSRWNVKPESITLREIRLRRPDLAAQVEPLFAQADEVIYSGRASTGVDLAEWERRTRELLQLQPA